MTDTFYLAWRYIAYHRLSTVILTAAIALTLYLPAALRTVVGRSEEQLMARATATPLLVGAKGSSLDLAIDSLYFQSKPLPPISMAQLDRIAESGLGLAIPLFTPFQAQRFTIVGTTLDYFAFRQLNIARGRPMAVLGDCVIGFAVAEQLELQPGDALLSSPENLFDLSGTYPLKMHVAGVLRKSHSPDDRAVFVDVKTAWVIRGLGHGHQDLAKVEDPDVLLGKEGNEYTANAKLLKYNEITPQNIESFHFHGQPEDSPLTAIVVVPQDKKSGTLLEGRYQSRDEPCQIIRPRKVVADLIATIFKVQRVLGAVLLLVSVATVLLIVLVVMLSVRLRQREVETMFKLGCGRLKIVEMLGCELGLIFLAGTLIAALGTTATARYIDEILRRVIF